MSWLIGNLARFLRPLTLAALAMAAGACTPLGLFATFTPRDPAVLGAVDQAYGDKARQTLDVYAPRQIDASRPIAVFLYGGGWEKGRKWDYGWVAQALAARGFVVVLPDYRLYPDVRFPDFLRDNAKAVRWAVDHAGAYGGDPNRIVLLGHSAGAYNAVMLGLDPSYLEAAGVDPSHIRAVAGIAGPYDFLPLTPDMDGVFGHASDVALTQPLNFVRPDAPPMLLVTGDADVVVDPANTTVLARALGSAGASVQEKHYPNVGHNEIMAAMSRPFRDRVPVLSDISDFLMREAD